MSNSTLNKYREAIREYYNEIEIIGKHDSNEGNISGVFYSLLKNIAKRHNLSLIGQYSLRNKKGKLIKPDGTIKNAIGIDFGYWEAKDSKDNLHKEIESKFNIGYPTENILFENGKTAILYQEGERVLEVEDIREEEKFAELLDKFITYKPEEIAKFEKAIQEFKANVPSIAESLKKFMDEQKKITRNYIKLRNSFLEDCQKNINPDFTVEDIREMIVQHILTEDIFNAIFGDKNFHKNNNVASTIESIIETFMTRKAQMNYLKSIQYYYDTITIVARKVVDHNDKQKFLKMIYEEFYKAYNIKAHDRLGIVYTPNEIVDFMIRATDHLLNQHFDKGLRDKKVKILDPCTGTGTFITSILKYIPSQYLDHKYQHEIFANELSILSYYIAALNIEYTYYEKMKDYKEYENIVFADTLDNINPLKYPGKQVSIDSINFENTKRIIRQNEQEISVIIGNPPYNANQKKLQ